MNLWRVSASLLFMSAAIGGCPLEGPTIPDNGSQSVAGRAASSGGGGTRANSGGRGGTGVDGVDIDAIRMAVNTAGAQVKLPEAPTEDTLCSLRFTDDDEQAGTSFDEVKKLIGEPGSEAQSKSEAGLQYRFRDGTGASFRFEWREELHKPYHDEDIDPDYFLSGGDLQGRPYPHCWPHEDPTD